MVRIASFNCLKVATYRLASFPGRTRSTSAVAKMASRQAVPEALSQLNSKSAP